MTFLATTKNREALSLWLALVLTLLLGLVSLASATIGWADDQGFRTTQGSMLNPKEGNAAIIVPTASYAAPATANVVSIAAARSQVGQEVTVAGSVTVPSGTFESATFDKGFAIQDDTAGIYVSIATDLKLNFHKKVRVTGVVQDDGFGLLILKVDNPANVEVLAGAKQIKAQEFATGALGESTEGSLVTVAGIVTQPIRDDRPFGFGVFLDDGSGEIQVFIHVTSGINPFKIPFVQEGQHISVTGFSGQFQEFIEVSPRIRGDIKHVQK